MRLSSCIRPGAFILRRLVVTLGMIAPEASAQVAAWMPADPTRAELRADYAPDWASAPVLRELSLAFDPALGSVANGARLKDAVQALAPGDRLTVGRGVWSVDSLFIITLSGTASAPIRVEAEAGESVVLTRPNAGQNLVNFGEPGVGRARFFLLRGFELTGGSIGVRIRDAEDLWLDQCEVHHTGAACIRASENSTARLHITRCHIHDSSVVNDSGEGIYLGANGGAAVSRDTVIAQNHIHDTRGSQGDGIEVKQGSSGCVVAENLVHDTQYPGILVYGTDGAPRNVVEGNTIYRTGANALQVQGEALVRNNVVFGGPHAAFVSFDHQGQVRDLEVVHNTFVSAGADAARLQNWGARPGMVLANNALYSASARAIDFLTGAAGVQIAGNVVYGSVYGDGGAAHVQGTGLADFADASWDGARLDVHPAPGATLAGAASASFTAEEDLTGALRPAAAAAGALEPGTYGRYFGAAVAGAGGPPKLRSSGLPVVGPLGGAPIELSIEDVPPATFGLVGLTLASEGGAPLPGVAPVQRIVGFSSPQGRIRVPFALPPVPALLGLHANVQGFVRDSSAPGQVSSTRRVEWRLP